MSDALKHKDTTNYPTHPTPAVAVRSDQPGVACHQSIGRPTGKRPGEALIEARRRIGSQGTGAVSDAELLAVCLGTVGGSGVGVEFARRLLHEFGSLRDLLHAPYARLERVPGLGSARIATLKALLAIGQRQAEQALRDRPLMTDSTSVREYLAQQMAGLEQEVFACLFLNTRHHLLGFRPLFYGSVDRASVHPREVLKAALACNAAAVVLAHNHPSGHADPSPSDITLTGELRDLLHQIDVRLLDHVVVGHGQVVSLAERGLI